VWWRILRPRFVQLVTRVRDDIEQGRDRIAKIGQGIIVAAGAARSHSRDLHKLDGVVDLVDYLLEQFFFAVSDITRLLAAWASRRGHWSRYPSAALRPARASPFP
jgi:hypothetical protein